MTTHSSLGGRVWPALLILALLGVVLAVASILRAQLSQTAPAAEPTATPTNTPTPYPSNYPKAKQTIEVAAVQTREAALKTPLPEGTVWYFPEPTPTLMPEQLTPPQGTPAGNGQIFDNLPISWSKLIGFRPLTKWDKVVGDRDITVISGVGMNDTTQGWIHVSVFAYSPYQDLIEDGEYPAPSQTGGVRIVGAQGDRLILLSDAGTTLYFDVPGRTFVGSLTEVVVTATPVPYTPAPTARPAFSDDAPNSPEDISQNSPVNTDLRYLINPSGDVDWFRFHTEVTSTLTVHLEDLPADYSLDVFSATDPQVRGSSSQSGTADRLVTLTNAAPNDYYVEVAGVNGAWSATAPYLLRFDMPQSSIASNFNGTAIAASNYIWFNSILKDVLFDPPK